VHGRMGMKRVILQEVWHLLSHPWFFDVASAQLQTCWQQMTTTETTLLFDKAICDNVGSIIVCSMHDSAWCRP
jgi:hypothetical protein